MRKIYLYLSKQVYSYREETTDPKLMGEKTNTVHIKQESVILLTPSSLSLALSVLLHTDSL